MRASLIRAWLLVFLVAICAVLAGCATALPKATRAESHALVGSTGSPLRSLLEKAALPKGASGAWPLLDPAVALDARIALIESAQTSLDLQYFVFADDRVGSSVLEALKQAGARGVRVRVLLDDLNTKGMDKVLLAFAGSRNIELRLFNPFVRGRESSPARWLDLALDFDRLQRRMHNKLFMADGAFAIVGGRNIGVEYFGQAGDGSFLDFDLLLTGSVLPELAAGFDGYWNSPYAIPAEDLIAPVHRSEPLQVAASEREGPAPPTSSDQFGAPPLRTQLQSGTLRVVEVQATTFADAPKKADPRERVTFEETLTHKVFELFGEARSNVVIITPYFIPAKKGLQRLRASRDAGVRVRVYTNSLAATDMPLVNVNLNRYKAEVLEMGVEMYEIGAAHHSPGSETENSTPGSFLNSTYGRLHAKVAAIDQQLLLVGSLNLDPRSSRFNTEVGVAVRSSELTGMVMNALKLEDMPGTFKLGLLPGTRTVVWTEANARSSLQQYRTDPGTSWWQRFKLLLLSMLIPEAML